MKFTKNIEEMLKTCIFSGFVKDERPVTLMLTADPEHGKSELIMQYTTQNNPPLYAATDFTVTALRNMMHNLKEGKITHIVCPDFIKIVSRKGSAVENVTTMLNALIEEGILRIDIYGYLFESSMPVRCGLISAITPTTLHKRKIQNVWKAIGLDTRMLFFSWSYTKDQKEAIRDMIRHSKHKPLKPIKLKLPKRPLPVTLDPSYAATLTPLINEYTKKWPTPGFRFQKQLQTLLKARALMAKRKDVNDTDVSDILRLSTWINLQENPIEE